MWPGQKRFNNEYRAELAKVLAAKIGGTRDGQQEFFDRAVAQYPSTFTETCGRDGTPYPLVPVC